MVTFAALGKETYQGSGGAGLSQLSLEEVEGLEGSFPRQETP